MLHEAGEKSVEHRRWGLVAESVDLEQHRTTDPTGEGATVLDREHRVGGAVHDQGRDGDLPQTVEPAGGTVDGDTMSGRRLPSGREFGGGQPPRRAVIVGKRVTGHEPVEFGDPPHPFPGGGGRPRIEPMHHRLDEPIDRPRESLVPGTRRRTHQGERTHPPGVLHRHHLGDHPSHRPADEMGGIDLESVEQADEIGREVGEEVASIGSEPRRCLLYTSDAADE